MDSNNKGDFKAYRRAISSRIPADTRSYKRWGYYNTNPVADDFTLEEILQIIRTGDLESLRELSRYYYRTNGEYRNNIDFLAHLFLYESVIIPVFQEGKGSQTQIIKSFYNACDFIDKLDLPTTLSRITTEWLITGIYNGILREKNGAATIQDLPVEYCRTRFKDFNNLNILEFNLNYFERITDDALREEAIGTFPDVVQKAWRRWVRAKRRDDPWVAIPAAQGGISLCFSGLDQTPLLIASIPELKKLDDATKREEKRDENELYKLLIQKMPIDSNGELVFQLDEVADIHASIAEMLKEIDTVDVLTTFGDTDLESLQESSSATQSADRIEKYRKNAWDSMGRGEILFNATNSSSLSYSIKKDESLMNAYINVYELIIKFFLNQRFSRKGLTFDFQILPITVFNREDMQNSYLRCAQYGYSKMLVAAAYGIKQNSQLSLMDFENDFLKMSVRMVPLQSSYTTSGVEVANEEKSNTGTQNTTKTTQVKDITNTGGRPELPDEKKSEKTQANIAAQG